MHKIWSNRWNDPKTAHSKPNPVHYLVSKYELHPSVGRPPFVFKRLTHLHSFAKLDIEQHTGGVDRHQDSFNRHPLLKFSFEMVFSASVFLMLQYLQYFLKHTWAWKDSKMTIYLQNNTLKQTYIMVKN